MPRILGHTVQTVNSERTNISSYFSAGNGLVIVERVPWKEKLMKHYFLFSCQSHKLFKLCLSIVNLRYFNIKIR